MRGGGCEGVDARVVDVGGCMCWISCGGGQCGGFQ